MRLPGPAHLPWPSIVIAGTLVLATGLPAAAQLVAQPPVLGYPTVMVGRSGPTFPLVLRNLNHHMIRLQNIVLTGQAPMDFQMTPAACPQPDLVPGAACLLHVTFIPTQAGSRTAHLLVPSDVGLVVVPLFGQAVPTGPELHLLPASLTFTGQPVGSAATSQSVALFNGGLTDLHVSGMTVVGSGAPDFTINTPCGQALIPPGSSCGFFVHFSPTATGPRSATLVVTSDSGGPGAQSFLPLSGRGARPELTALPGSLEFGNRWVGVRGADGSLLLQNSGDATLTITGLSLSGGHAGDFLIPTGYSCSAAPGQSCAVQIGFVTTTAATRVTELVFASNVPGPSARVTLRGTGQFPPTPATLLFDDHRFLSAGSFVPVCGTMAAPPPSLLIPVNRVVGPVPAGGGRLLAPGPLVAAGVLSATATLEVMAYNVTSPPGQPAPRVIFNGVSSGFLTGQAGGWSLTTLNVPIGIVNFPRRIGPATPPFPVSNTVGIAVGAGGPEQCAAPAWARLTFMALSPVVFVHGNGSDGLFFVRQGLAGFLDGIGVPNDRSINLASGTLAADAATLQARLPAVAASFGVNSIHVIAHSKGGLDMRSWLGTFGTANAFRVLSLTTLSTPHRGSPLADAAVAVNASGIGVPGLPSATLGFLGVGSSLPNLTTSFTAGFNPPLPAGADYRMIGADADRFLDGVIRSFPVDEYAAARSEESTLAAIFAVDPGVSDAIVTAAYHFVRNTAMVRLTVVFIPIPIPPFFIPLTVPLPLPNFFPAPNDLLVSLPSALGAPPPFVPAAAFTGGAGRDHASIANAGVGATVLPLLIITDSVRGDLR